MSLRTRQKELESSKPQFMAVEDVPLDIEIDEATEFANRFLRDFYPNIQAALPFEN